MAELLWDGKYDTSGRRIAPPRVALPLQRIETVNESALERQKSLDLFSSGQDDTWRNRLIWGDKKYVLPSLLPDFAGQLDLIYIDPPFGTGQNFVLPVRIGPGIKPFDKQPSVMEVKAYRDTWNRGMDGYIQWFYETAALLFDLLAPTGSLYVHMDSHFAAYAKVVLDEVFTVDNFVREIIWRIGWISGYKAKANNWARNHDTILFYVKDRDKFTFNKQMIEHDPNYQRASYGSEEAADVAIVDDETGEVIETKGKPIDDVWLNLPSIQIMSFSGEKTGFPTQKNEDLLTRIVQTSSNPNDLVADFFSGSGTTAAVAEKLGRRWIASDVSRYAIHTARKRLLSQASIRPFDVLNLGKYERQVWQQAEFGDQAERRVLAYRKFILELYRAKGIEGYLFLHGVKGGRFVYVGTVDSPVTVSDVRQVLAEFDAAVGMGSGAPSTNGIDVLGWEFAFELNELAKQEAARANVDLHFVRIPREVLDKRAVASGDVQFFELGALAVNVTVEGRTLGVEITDFLIPVDDVPQDVQTQIKHWSQWIDYWAIDWDNKGDTFHNEWQTYRTKKEPKLSLDVSHEYPTAGPHRVVIKVIDILGNDTTKTVEVEVG